MDAVTFSLIVFLACIGICRAIKDWGGPDRPCNPMDDPQYFES